VVDDVHARPVDLVEERAVARAVDPAPQVRRHDHRPLASPVVAEEGAVRVGPRYQGARERLDRPLRLVGVLRGIRFRSGLGEIMKFISSRISSHFQIEFVFNIVKVEHHHPRGQFHVVQLTQLPEFKFEPIDMPEQIENRYLSIRNLQGHGIKHHIKYAVVISPFIYTREKHDRVRDKLFDINQTMKKQNENYIII
jgi:hypothetical protein